MFFLKYSNVSLYLSFNVIGKYNPGPVKIMNFIFVFWTLFMENYYYPFSNDRENNREFLTLP